MKSVCVPVPKFVVDKFDCWALLLSAICVRLGQLVDHSKKQVIELGYVAAEAVMKARDGFPVGFGIVYMVWKVLVADSVPLVLRPVSVVSVEPTLVAPTVRVLKLPVPEQVKSAHDSAPVSTKLVQESWVKDPIPPVILVKFATAKVMDPATERALLQFTFPFKVLVLETDSTP